MIQFCSRYRYLLSSDPSFMVEDPLSICEQYESPLVCKWRLVTTLLLRKPITTAEILADVISSLQPDYEFKSLCAALQSSEVGHEIIFATTLPSMLKVALRMPELFPTGELRVLSPGEDSSLSLTREQAACLLAHMFFCTLQPQEGNKYWVNFSVWYAASNCLLAYTACLLQPIGFVWPTSMPQGANRVSSKDSHKSTRLEVLGYITLSGDSISSTRARSQH